MTNCTLKLIGARGEKFLHRCTNCGHSYVSRHADPAKYRVNCAVNQAATIARAAPHGPGTELTILFSDNEITEKPGCNCRAIAAEMDRQGPAGCRDKRKYFIGKLGENSKHYRWWEKIHAATKLRRQSWFNLADPLGSCFDEAVRRAAEKESNMALSAAERLSRIGPPHIAPNWRRRLRTEELLLADHCLNPSIHEHGGKVYLAYRRGWGRARIVLGELDSDLNFLWQRELALPLRDRALLAHEDPRLFSFGGALHVAYTGCMKQERLTVASICYARLDGEGNVLADFQPRYAHAQAQEKNWSFFEHTGRLHAVYWISGRRRIIHIDGDDAQLAHDYEQDLPFPGGEPRGGASPILYGGQWHAFFHSVAGQGAERVYAAGMYAFEDRPPFQIVRFVKKPIILPNPGERPLDKLPHCIYPAGAIRRGNEWVVSFGYFDTYCELAAFDANALEALCMPL